ncbi:MAG TPA: GNAT family N-acetyltransferase [Thermoclostridium caenicola]|uniref:GNAT acetyltransferase n=1 Tax=Thermoclostridium caenicola TaxID=659425 RepID=A0A1M6C548_9FIRM|nr:GNAT family N-acetyltransferase [Thermoclostridium caenicola]SHI55854.1 GNAT acetyltransferase [Thermoclostridium caenicola]HOK42993.1 GNAT family N-acetyltransferase [Thermoclostridium caenicola]HOL84615.1 GNAT family N-acetyltransferase [Thermoclostridium caenicola]HPO76732.1 GNAT family N-acetyltransferase [Thermoclostridium caenicola]
MIIEMHRDKRAVLAPVFSKMEHAMIQACLQGHMGHAWADDAQNPTCGKIMVGDIAFLAGRPINPAARELVLVVPSRYRSGEMYLVPETPEWDHLIENLFKGRCYRFQRYAFHHEADGFDREKLAGLMASLPEGYAIEPIDARWYGEIIKHAWSRDLCSQFASSEDYAKRGLGFCVIHNGQVVAGASSYALYDDGIEIQIDTREDHQRKGLAAACAAALILECLKRGLFPHWDAANMASVKLAEKLGYRLKGPYDTWGIRMEPSEGAAP